MDTLKWLVRSDSFCPLVPKSRLAMGTRFGNDVSLNGSAAIGSSTLMGTTLAGTTGGGGGSDSNLSPPSELEEGIF
jgi:hypothetical protein